MRVETEAQHNRRILRELKKARAGWRTVGGKTDWEAFKALAGRPLPPATTSVFVNGREIAITQDQLDAIYHSANAAMDYDCSPSAERMIEAVLRTLERAGVVFIIMPPAMD